MILVDTVIWSHHLRSGDSELATRLGDLEVAVHPWIVGELSLGPGMTDSVLRDLERLPQAPIVPHSVLMAFIELHRLRGIGYVDAQLPVSALESRWPLWTRDRALEGMASRFEIAAPLP